MLHCKRETRNVMHEMKNLLDAHNTKTCSQSTPIGMRGDIKLFYHCTCIVYYLVSPNGVGM